MFHKEGAKIILISIVLFIVLLVGSTFVFSEPWILKPVQVLWLFLLVMILQFFRNPNRAIKPNDNFIIAPVDGKVVVIEEVFEPEYFKDKRLQVSIFMSPINVHVTRYAVGGKVKYSKYHPGKYLVAWHPKASTENERTTVVIESPVFGDILYRQIAGALAKRIVNYAVEGTEVTQGDGSVQFRVYVQDVVFGLAHSPPAQGKEVQICKEPFDMRLQPRGTHPAILEIHAQIPRSQPESVGVEFQAVIQNQAVWNAPCEPRLDCARRQDQVCLGTNAVLDDF